MNFSITKIKEGPFREVILVMFLWLLIWSGYNTGIERVFNHGFPHDIFDLIHGIRAFFPIVAGVWAVSLILIKKYRISAKFFASPLGLLSVYSFLGIFFSIFSNEPIQALYWGLMYGSVIAVLCLLIYGQKATQELNFVINLNWIISALLAVGLVVFLLIQPGVIHSFTYNFLVCAQRPYEGLGNIMAQPLTFGMAGTRPTGLARYAGVVAIVAFAWFLFSKKWKKALFLVAFIIFLALLLFTKGKTEFVAFIAAAIIILWFYKHFKTYWIMLIGSLILLTGLIISSSIPCANDFSFVNSLTRYFSFVKIQNFNPKPETFVPKIVATNPAPTQNSSNNSVSQQATPSIRPVPSTLPSSSAVAQSQAQVIKPQVIEQAPASSPQSPVADKSIKTILSLSGRVSGVWTDAWQLFMSSPIFGRGFQADRFFLNGQHVHSSLLHVLLQAGLLGAVPFILAYVIALVYLFLLFRNKNIVKEQKIILIASAGALIFFLVRGITESLAFYSSDWIFVAPIIAYIQHLNSQLNKNQSIIKEGRMFFSGIKINIMRMSEVMNKFTYWIKNESVENHWVVVTGMHGIVEASKHTDFKYILNSADLFVPDGISLVWLARLKGFGLEKRISGADLMQEFLKISEQEGFKNYFYGDTEDTLKKLSEKFPKVKIDSYSPPFRELTIEEDEKIIEKINLFKPDILWVGLGLPKQEKWIYQHKDKLKVSVIVGVGAAFKFLSGKVRRAPKWMGDAGFEWLWRLFIEPKTVWRRIFLDGSFFVWLLFTRLAAKVSWKFLHLRQYIMWPIGAILGSELLKQLTPYDVSGFEEKIRLGNLSDGGYVIPSKILPFIQVAYCYGVADNADFEEDLVKRIDVPVRLYDHTVDRPPIKNNNFFFKRQGIANKKYRTFDTFENHLKDNGDVSKKILLKMDIEGNELHLIDKIVGQFSDKIVACILEMHMYGYGKTIDYIEMLKKINSKFTLVHLHANNCSSLFNFGGKKIPNVLELTLINNYFVKEKKVMSSSLPSKIDYPNITGKKDVVLDFWRKF